MIEKISEQLEEEREYSYANFEEYVKEKSPYLDAEYDDLFHRGLERAANIVQKVAKEYAAAVKENLTSEKDGEWIPVEQKMPEDFTHVYATCISLIDDREPWVTEGVYHSVIGFGGMAPMLSMKNAVVIAWMPKKLPAPYQKGEAQKDCSACANNTDFDEIDNGCYMCCKGLENNYEPIQQKGE